MTEPECTMVDHLDLIEGMASTQLARAAVSLRAAVAGFTESRQAYYEQLLIPLRALNANIEERIRHATLLETFAVTESQLNIFLRMVSSGRVTQVDINALCECIGGDPR